MEETHTKPSRGNKLAALPEFLLAEIFSHIHPSSLRAVSGVSRMMRNLASESLLRVTTDTGVAVHDHGYWVEERDFKGHKTLHLNFWVDLAIFDFAYHKQVGIIWTADEWKTASVGLAEYKNPLPPNEGDAGAFEKWGLNVEVGEIANKEHHSDVQFCPFLLCQGDLRWDANNPHSIFGRVVPADPVRFLYSSFEPPRSKESAGCIMGRVRVFDTVPRGPLFVRYTEDAWRSSRDVNLVHVQDHDWSFCLDVDFGTELCEFAVCYSPAKAHEIWDNNSRDELQWFSYVSSGKLTFFPAPTPLAPLQQLPAPHFVLGSHWRQGGNTPQPCATG